MTQSILSENQKKRLNQPLWMLVCFAMFCFWQMGFIYFIGPSLTVNGKTPLPIDMDNATALIAVCYILSILWMIFLPKIVVWTQRICTGIAIASAIGLFLPLSDDAMRLLIYIQIFCCCLLIGFEAFIMINYFTEHSNIRHLTIAYAVSLFMIAFIQNDFIPITFPQFRVIMVVALLLLLTFFIRMPAGKNALPVYVKKSDGITAPRAMLFGTYVFVFVGALMAVSGPAIAGEAEHGVFITYLVDAVASLVIYLLYKMANIHPFKLIPILVGLGCIGFLLMYAATVVPALSYISCGLIGIGMVPCQMLPLYGMVMMKSYPSKYISPMIIGLSLVAVLVQSSMVELFREAPNMLYLAYGVIMVILVIIYMQIEPFFLFILRRHIGNDEAEIDKTEDSLPVEQPEATNESTGNPLNVLTKKEREVAELICLGYTNKDIAKLMFISEHTVKDHTKKIYPKMGVHSRFELASVVSKYRVDEKK